MVETNQMMGEKCKPEWRIIKETIQGASHQRSGKPNQDAVDQLPESDESLPLILAVSDGHGGAKYFRSEKGAKFAVSAAKDTLSQFQESFTGFSNPSLREELLTKSLINTWRGKITTHLIDEPFTDEELEKLEKDEGLAARKVVEDNPVLAYGATILAVMVAESFIVYLQLGDGDILTVSELGQPESVFPVNSKHFANETTSLCSSNAWCDVQFRVEKLCPTSVLPALILLSTDGYKDSFSTFEEFRKVGTDLFEMLLSGKQEEIKSNLAGWLTEASQIGSGDDITLGILYRLDAIEQPDTLKALEQEQADHTKVEGIELDAQSGDCHGSLQPDQTMLWDTSRGDTEGTMDC